MVKLNVFGSHKGLNKRFLEQVLDKAIISLMIVEESSINLIFSSREEMQGLNKKYRGKDEPTDVLSFIYDEEDCKGEIAVYLGRIEKDSEELRVSFKEGFTRVFIHGILHLYGYDHEKSGKDEELMRKNEEEIFWEIK